MRPEQTVHSPAASQQTTPTSINAVPSQDSGASIDGDLLGMSYNSSSQQQQNNNQQSLPDIPGLGASRPSDSVSATSGSADDDTAQSSTAHSHPLPEEDGDNSQIGRFIENTSNRIQMRLTTVGPVPEDEPPLYAVEGDVPDEDDDMYEGQVRPLIYGYLLKLGRNGKWQRRFFETDGESLSYYKSEKRIKLLATLDLNKVGTIAISSSDPSGRTFVIQVADRPYSLQADSKAKCKDWVITLNRIKEARLQMGHVKLVQPDFHHRNPTTSSRLPPDLLDKEMISEDLAARVVLSANRPRTRAVNDTVTSWEQLVEQSELQQQQEAMLAYDTASQRQKQHHATVHGTVMARWVKPRTVMTRIKRKLVKWARSISCVNPTKEQILAMDPTLRMAGAKQYKTTPSESGTESKEEVSIHDGFAATREIS